MINDVKLITLTPAITADGYKISHSDNAAMSEYFEYRLCDGGSLQAWWGENDVPVTITFLEGRFKTALFDNRPESSTHGEIWESYAGGLQPLQLVIPPGVLWGWKVVGGQPGRLLLSASQEPGAQQFYPADTPLIPYSWK